MQAADSLMPQRLRVLPTQDVPTCRRLSHTHCVCGRSAPTGSEVLSGGQVVLMKSGPLVTQSFHSLNGSNLRDQVCCMPREWSTGEWAM